MPNIIIKDANGKLIKTYQIYVGEFGSLITNEHLFEMAKRNAIEDELVSEEEADKLFYFVDD